MTLRGPRVAWWSAVAGVCFFFKSGLQYFFAERVSTLATPREREPPKRSFFFLLALSFPENVRVGSDIAVRVGMSGDPGNARDSKNRSIDSRFVLSSELLRY